MPRRFSGVCVHCGSPYSGSRSPEFCSRQCYVDSHWTESTCDHCGKIFRTRIYYLDRGQMKFCSPECSHAANITKPQIEFNGMLFSKNVYGYYTTSDGKHLLHREVWEQHHGPVPPGYVVHHKDEDKKNNDISNLEPMEWGAHTRHHNIKSPKLPKKPYALCKIPGCGQKNRGRGLCSKHYQQLRVREVRTGLWKPQNRFGN